MLALVFGSAFSAFCTQVISSFIFKEELFKSRRELAMTDLGWIVQLATAVSLLATAAAAVLALLEYRLKVSTERRETDIRLMQLFAESVRTAQSRSGDQVSEKCIEQLFEKGIVTKEDFEDLDDKEKYERLFNKLRTCVIAAPTSEASQNAAIIAIAVLGKRYKETLDLPARAGLETMKKHKDQKEQAEKALAYLDTVEPT
jgi:hypothetical protein